MTDKEQDLVFSPAQVSSLVLETLQGNMTRPGGGVRLHIPSIDAGLLPLRPSELVTVMGRPSNFKTGLMGFWAREEARRVAGEDLPDEIVVFVTWEMAVEELGLFDIAAQAGLDASELAQGKISQDEWKRLEEAAMKRSALPIWLLGHSIKNRRKRHRLTMSNVIDALRWVEDNMGLRPRVVFLDYLQLMEAEVQGDRRVQVADNVDKCKDLARAMGCPVVVGVQARRDVDGRDWKLPQMGDGMETASIEHTADKMLSVWMPKTSEPVGTAVPGADGLLVTENLLIVGVMKQRFGSAGWWRPLYVEPGRGKLSAMVSEKVEL